MILRCRPENFLGGWNTSKPWEKKQKKNAPPIKRVFNRFFPIGKVAWLTALCPVPSNVAAVQGGPSFVSQQVAHV